MSPMACTETVKQTDLLSSDMYRRQVITAIGTVGIAGLAGCSGLTGDLEYTAAPATLDPEVAAAEGYDTEGPSVFAITETVEVAGESREVGITTWTTGYQSDTGPCVVLSTPAVTLAGQSLNPLAQLSGSELITRLLEELGGGASTRELEAAGETELSIFGEARTIEEFTGVLETGGGGAVPSELNSDGGVPIRLYLLSTTHEYGDGGSDVIFALGFQPQALVDAETMHALFESLQHPVEPPETANATGQ